MNYAICILLFMLKCANYFFHLDYRQTNRMCSLLDLVRDKIQSMKNHRDDDAPNAPRILLKEGVNYLSSFNEGSYQWFVAKGQVDVAQNQDKQSMVNYGTQLKKHNEREGVEEKKHAVEALLIQFASLETTLLDKGAKTFRELYPDNLDKESPSHHSTPYKPSPPKAFEIKFDFHAHDMTDETREGYIKLSVSTVRGI
jgi:hypothetical protein